MDDWMTEIPALIVKEDMRLKWLSLLLPSKQQIPPDRLSLLGLPAEVRILIYTFLFSSSSQALGKLPSLLYVNKQIHSEAIPLYYQETTFTFWIESFNRTLATYRKLPKRHRTAIRHLRYPTVYSASTSAAAAKVPLIQAKKLSQARNVLLPYGFLQVGVRRFRYGIDDGEIVWTSDPEALAREWIGPRKLAGRFHATSSIVDMS